MVDNKGNVYLVANKDDENEDDEYGNEDDDEEEMNEEEFLQMMEREEAEGRIGMPEQNSTIINSSQNTSLEDNFIAEWPLSIQL